MKVKDVLIALNEIAPPELAEEFDNVGLLVGDGEAEVSAAVVALDCTESVIRAAKDAGAGLIITHHPVIFDPLTGVTADMTVYRLIKVGISLISAHTNLDFAAGGVNDILCEKIGLKEVKALPFGIRLGKTEPSDPAAFAASVKKALGGAVKFTAGQKTVEKVAVCSGSGGSLLTEAAAAGADAFVTADVKHSVFIEAVRLDITLIDAGHYDTEQVIVEPLAKRLAQKLPSAKFIPFSEKFIQHM